MSSISFAALGDDNLSGTAFPWLCQSTVHADVDVRTRWPEAKAQLQAKLRAGPFRFGVLPRVSLPTGDEVDLWPARDALALKALALVLGCGCGVPPGGRLAVAQKTVEILYHERSRRNPCLVHRHERNRYWKSYRSSINAYAAESFMAA